MQSKETDKISSLPVKIVEDHNEVLYYLYRALGSKKLPFQNGTIVHFDSHPDLVIPEKFDIEKIYDKEYVISAVSIESWLLPTVYAKHFSNIAWIKPPWSTQISEGRHEFKIGSHKVSKDMKVSCPEAYFVSELGWADADSIENESDVLLEVCSLVRFEKPSSSTQVVDLQENSSCNRCSGCLFSVNPSEKLLTSSFQSCLNQKPFVLDIDLDFYSTRNPFRELFTEQQFKVLSRLYHYEHVDDPLNKQKLEEVSLKRKKQLSELRSSILQVMKGEECSTIANQELAWLLAELKASGSEVDFEMIHYAGCTCDDCDLPHHVSNRSEIIYLIEATKEFLKILPIPSLVTISRSSSDDYCPPEDVEFIQASVLEMLKDLYKELDIYYDYQNLKNDENI